MLAACSEEIQSAETLSELNYQNYLYGGKELDRKFGINAYDFTGRYYDLTDNRFWSMDPMAEKYYSISPYAYCANNPLRFIDPDGRLVLFTNEAKSDPKYVNDFTKSVQYLNSKGAGGKLKELNDSKEVYYIDKSYGDVGNYDANNRTITWNPTLGLETNEGHSLSPTTVLNHEIGHAVQHDKYPSRYISDVDPKKGFDSQFKTKEESRNIQETEQETAKKLGEITDGEVTRKDHGGQFFKTMDPTSNINLGKLKDIIITK